MGLPVKFMRYMPIAEQQMINKLNCISVALGWGPLEARMLAFSGYPSFFWASEAVSDLRFEIHAIQPALTRAEVLNKTRVFSKFQFNVISYKHHIYAGPLIVPLPTRALTTVFAEVLLPFFRRSNFETATARKQFLRTYPTTKWIMEPGWRPPCIGIESGKIVCKLDNKEVGTTPDATQKNE